MTINIENVKILLNLFSNSVSTLGESSKAVKFYKEQAAELEKMGKVTIQEIDLVNEIIGMKNTDAVKWEQADKNLNMFVLAVQNICNYTNKLAISLTLAKLADNKHINKKIQNLVLKMANIDKNAEITKPDLVELATIHNFTTTALNELKITNESYNTMLRLFDTFINEYKNYTIQTRRGYINPVINIGAGSTVDCYENTDKVQNLTDNINLIRNLALKESTRPYVGIIKDRGNTINRYGNHARDIEFIIDNKATDMACSIDWKVIYIHKMLNLN